MDVNKEVDALADALYGPGKAPAAFGVAVRVIAAMAFAQGRTVAYTHAASVLEEKFPSGLVAPTLN